MELSKQLYREIEELQVKELFRAYNPDHMERKHILVTDGGSSPTSVSDKDRKG